MTAVGDRGQVPSVESYDPQFFAQIAAVEDRHFWFCARNRVIGAAMQRVVLGLNPGYRVLEVGCGTGGVLQRLVEVCAQGRVMGMDIFPEAVAFASRRAGCPVVQGDFLNPPSLERCDVVGMFDVLEHLPDDVGVLRSINRLLPIGGRAVLTVPAGPSLWSYFDVSARHCRRYEADDLAAKLTGAGFRVEFLTPFMLSIYPLVWLSRRLRGGGQSMESNVAAAKSAAELKIVPGVNALLRFVLGLEAKWVGRQRTLPLGTSLLVVARKKTDA